MADPNYAMMVDPQDYAQALRQQALSQALTQSALAGPTQPQAPSGGKYFVQPRVSPLAGVSKLMEAMLANKTFQQGTAAQQRFGSALMNSGQGYLDTATGGSGNRADYATRMEALNRAHMYGLVTDDQAKQIGEQINAENKPSEFDPTLRAMGLQPGTPEYQAASGKMAQKQTYSPPVEIRQGNVAIDPYSHEPLGFNPEQHYEPDPFHPGTGHFVPAPAPPGVSPGVGQPLPGQGAPPSGAPAANPPAVASPAPTGAPAPPSKYFPTGGTAGDLAAQQAGAKSGAESGQAYSDQLVKNAENATEVRRSLSELRSLASTAGVSASNPLKLQLGSMLIAAGADPDWVSRNLHTDVGALTAATKQTGSLALDSIHSMTSRGTNFDLQTFMRYNPNLDMSSPDGFKRVTDFLDKRMQQDIAKQQDFDTWSQNVPQTRWASAHTSRWLKQQNALIDKGGANSEPPPPPPTPSYPRKQIGNDWYEKRGPNPTDWFKLNQ